MQSEDPSGVDCEVMVHDNTNPIPVCEIGLQQTTNLIVE